jgi:hypothetical protein
VAGPPAVTAPLQRSPRDRCGHRSVGGRRPFAHRHRGRSGAVAEELIQCRGGMVLPHQDSRRRGPSTPPQRHRQPGAWAASASAFNLCFSTHRTGELVHPVRVSTACPGTGTGHGTASAACPPPLHQRAVNSRLIEPGRESSTGVGGGRRTAGLPCSRARTVARHSSRLTWLSGDL